MTTVQMTDALAHNPLKSTAAHITNPDKHQRISKSIGIQTDERTGHAVSHGPYQPSDVVHDRMACMFRIKLDNTGRLAALCYLPTRFRSLVEFYHTEIPIAYRHLGIGDLLADQAFQWAEERQIFVIPTCPFVQRHLQKRHGNRQSDLWTWIVQSEYEGMGRLLEYSHKQDSNK